MRLTLLRRARGTLRVRALAAPRGCLCLLVAGCGSSSTPITRQQKVSSYVTYAACLNKHGAVVQVIRTGGLAWETGPGVPGLGSPQDLAAERDCKTLVPEGGLHHVPTAAETAENLTLMLRLARCMRAHGVPNFPDPTSQGLRIKPSSGINLSSPAFLTAQKNCRRDSLEIGGGS